MDPITTAIIASLAKLSEPVIKDSYNALKNLIVSKFGKGHDLAKAVEDVEKKPDSVGRKETLREEIAASEIDKDEEILKVANALIEKLKAQPGGQQVIQQTVSGNQNVFSGTGDVTVHSDPLKE
jgi:hypothetical protein